jgi:arylsulfatase B
MDAANDYWSQQYSSCPDKEGNPSLTDFWDTTEGAIGQNNSWQCNQKTQNNPALNCTWEDDKLQQRLLQRISEHDVSKPLFLFWSAHTVHEPYEVPTKDLEKYKNITVTVRQYYAAMVDHLDSLVPDIVNALKSKGMWENTLFIVTSDNGGPLSRTPPGTALENVSGSNNWPLKGGKIGVFEGGIRINSFASGGFLPLAVRGTIYSGWSHVADWYATFCALAGVDPTDYRAAKAGLPPIDSLDLSSILLGINTTSPRTEIIIGSSDVDDHSGNTIVAGLIDVEGWKLLIEARIAPAFQQGPVYPNTTFPGENSQVCGDPDGTGSAKGPGCLFNVLTDPSELNDLASTMPAKVAELRARITELQKGVFNPDRGTHDREMCLTGWGKNKGFLGPWID